MKVTFWGVVGYLSWLVVFFIAINLVAGMCIAAVPF